MTPEQQRIAILKATGWTDISTPNWRGSVFGRIGDGLPLVKCPDHMNDLNAMHDAEKIFDYDQAEQYASDLWAIVIEAEEGMEDPPPSNFACLHATATQRAEAFLKTLKLWEL